MKDKDKPQFALTQEVYITGEQIAKGVVDSLTYDEGEGLAGLINELGKHLLEHVFDSSEAVETASKLDGHGVRFIRMLTKTRAYKELKAITKEEDKRAHIVNLGSLEKLDDTVDSDVNQDEDI